MDLVFNFKSSNRMDIYLESAVIMDYLEALNKLDLIAIDCAYLEDGISGGRLHVYIEQQD